MYEENANKISFCADPDVRDWIESLDENDRTSVINALLRKGFSERDDVLPTLARRFTEKSLDAVHLAEQESRRQGHNFIGSEQLLIGLVAEGTGLAAKVLIELGAELFLVRTQVKSIIGKGNGLVAEKIPLTPRAKQIVAQSWQEAQSLGHNYIGTEHLLLALLNSDNGIVDTVLHNLDIDTEELKAKVLSALDQNKKS